MPIEIIKQKVLATVKKVIEDDKNYVDPYPTSGLKQDSHRLARLDTAVRKVLRENPEIPEFYTGREINGIVLDGMLYHARNSPVSHTSIMDMVYLNLETYFNKKSAAI